MSTWTNVPDSVLEPGDPIRSVDIIAIKNNISAVPNGLVGAPRVQTAAIQDAAVTSAKLAADMRMNTTNVLAATAGASVGAVGTYAFLGETSLTTTSPGGTRAGSALRYVSGGGPASWGADSSQSFNRFGGAFTTAPSGTWRCMGHSAHQNQSPYFTSVFPATVWLRIS